MTSDVQDTLRWLELSGWKKISDAEWHYSVQGATHVLTIEDKLVCLQLDNGPRTTFPYAHFGTDVVRKLISKAVTWTLKV